MAGKTIEHAEETIAIRLQQQEETIARLQQQII